MIERHREFARSLELACERSGATCHFVKPVDPLLLPDVVRALPGATVLRGQAQADGGRGSAARRLITLLFADRVRALAIMVVMAMYQRSVNAEAVRID
jgi:hypothetical protein